MAEAETPVPARETSAEEPKPVLDPETKPEDAAPAETPQPMEEDAPAAPVADEPAKPTEATDGKPGPEPAAAEPPKPTELPVRQYLESTVVSLLTAGMQQLVKERPEDPVAFLADYLTANNPSKKA